MAAIAELPQKLQWGCALCQVLPDLLEVCPEARINLAVHYLRQGQLQEAFKLIKDLQPATPQEYTLKGCVYISYAQAFGQPSHALSCSIAVAK